MLETNIFLYTRKQIQLKIIKGEVFIQSNTDEYSFEPSITNPLASQNRV